MHLHVLKSVNIFSIKVLIEDTIFFFYVENSLNIEIKQQQTL